MFNVDKRFKQVYDLEVANFRPVYSYTPPNINGHVNSWNLRYCLSHSDISRCVSYYPPKESEVYYIYLTPCALLRACRRLHGSSCSSSE